MVLKPAPDHNKNIMKTNTMLITFSGLDGAGKTTQIEQFISYLAERNHRVKRLAMYDDISTSALLRRMIPRKKRRPATTEPGIMKYRNDKNRKDTNIVFMRKITYLFDLAVLMMKKFYYQRIKGYSLIMDRYLYDSLANLNGTDSAIYTDIILKLAPKPDMAVLLDALPEIAFKRKPEYPPDYYKERRDAYLNIFSQVSGAAVIESKEGAITEVGKEIRDSFEKALRPRREISDEYSSYVEAVAETLYGTTVPHKSFFNDLNFRTLTIVLAKNRVAVRWLTKNRGLLSEQYQKYIDKIISGERERLTHALSAIAQVTREFESRNLSIMVIKTLDNYPDLGHDVDLYTNAPIKEIDDILLNVFKAKLETPNIAERIATKRNYTLPTNITLEIHCNKLGEVGEEAAVARDLIKTSIKASFEDVSCNVPAPEYRIILCALQRMYRHFNIRLCDAYNTITLIQKNQIDWHLLKKVAQGYGIWEGVLRYLSHIKKIADYYGVDLNIEETIKIRDWPAAIIDKNMHFRFPLLSTGIAVYTKRILSDIRHLRLASIIRLSLVIPMSLMHFASVKLFGKSRVW